MTALKRSPAMITWAGLLLSTFVGAPSSQAAETIKAAPVSAGNGAAVETPAATIIEEGGWNTKFALLFQMNNVLQVANILNDFEGGIGALYNLDPQSSLRVGLQLHRASNPEQVTKSTSTTGPTTTVTYTVNAAGPTNQTTTAVVADYLWRVTKHPLSPYCGLGLSASWDTTQTKITDSLTVSNQTTTTNNWNDTFAIGARGILGVGWRIHRYFEIFAEYDLALTVFAATQNKTQTTVNNSGATQQNTTENNYTRWLTWDLNLAHGGSLGLIVLF